MPALITNERYVGVDVSREMLAIARRKHPQACFLDGDGYDLQFADGEFDFTIAFEVLGHLPEIGPLVRELARVARDAAIFTVWPAADGVVESKETLCGADFLHRNYSHDYICQQILEWLPETALEMEAGILRSGTWAYVLRKREGQAGLTLNRLYPVSGD